MIVNFKFNFIDFFGTIGIYGGAYLWAHNHFGWGIVFITLGLVVVQSTWTSE
jgi:hypothetical protein